MLIPPLRRVMHHRHFIYLGGWLGLGAGALRGSGQRFMPVVDYPKEMYIATATIAKTMFKIKSSFKASYLPRDNTSCTAPRVRRDHYFQQTKFPCISKSSTHLCTKGLQGPSSSAGPLSLGAF